MQCTGTVKKIIKLKDGKAYTSINVAVTKDLGNNKMLLSRNAETENAKTFHQADFYEQKLSRVSENFQKVSETFHSVRKTFQSFRKVFQSVSKLSRVSRNFPECPETFQST